MVYYRTARMLTSIKRQGELNLKWAEFISYLFYEYSSTFFFIEYIFCNIFVRDHVNTLYKSICMFPSIICRVNSVFLIVSTCRLGL